MKEKFYGLWVGIVSLVMFISCGSAKKEVSSLLTGRWNIVEVNGVKITSDKTPFVEFNVAEKRLYGNAGCNNFNASYKLDSSNAASLQILPAAATMMACPDMETEGKIFQALDKVASVKTQGNVGSLQLLDKDGAVVFLLEKAL